MRKQVRIVLCILRCLHQVGCLVADCLGEPGEFKQDWYNMGNSNYQCNFFQCQIGFEWEDTFIITGTHFDQIYTVPFMQNKVKEYNDLVYKWTWSHGSSWRYRRPLTLVDNTVDYAVSTDHCLRSWRISTVSKNDRKICDIFLMFAQKISAWQGLMSLVGMVISHEE